MKKILSLVLLGIFILTNIKAFAQSTSNASPVTVGVNTTNTYVNIDFPYPTRNLTVANNDANDYVYVDVKNPSNTFDIGACYLIAPGDNIELFDFITNGISIIRDTVYSSGNEASPISVIATY